MRATRIDDASATLTPLDPTDLLARSRLTLSAEPRPFVRWAGSKQRLLTALVEHLPTEFERYIEPFMGGGSMFFFLAPEKAILCDRSSELISTYRAVRNAPDAVLRHLRDFDPLNKEQFYAVRSDRSAHWIRRAAEFIYLNRACWNGLYRVNLKGEFNVPYGSPQTSEIVSASNLLECSGALNAEQVDLRSGDFEATLREAAEGDFVFLDPPYVTGHNNNGFVDYNQRIFSWADQERLAEESRSAVGRGAKLLLTNANHPSVIQLYSGFSVFSLERSSTLANNPTHRRKVTEAVIRSY